MPADARVRFTLDLDFAGTRAYPPSEYVGIVVRQDSATSVFTRDPDGTVRHC